MELINTGRRELMQPGARSGEPWAVAIREQYGPIEGFVRRFGIDQQKYCLENVGKAVMNHLPTFGRVAAAYGEKAFSAFINTHLTSVILKMGEERRMDAIDIQSVSEAIIESRHGRTLCFTTVLGFFHALKTGEYDIYGQLTPFKIMEAFRKCCDKMAALEDKYFREREDFERKLEFEKSRQRAISWEQYAAMKGIKDRNCHAYAQRLVKEEREALNGAGVFLGLMKNLVFMVSIVSDLIKIKKIS